MANSYLTIFKEEFQARFPFSVLTIYQAFGLNKTEAQIALNNTSVIRTNQDLITAIWHVHQLGRSTQSNIFNDQLSAVLKPYQLTISQFDKLLIVNMLPNSTPAITSQEASILYKILAPRFPHLVIKVFIEFHNDNGRTIRIRTTDDQLVRKLNVFFQSYIAWIDDHAKVITPQFDKIKSEINAFLTNSYGGINPSSEGFIAWYITTKLGKGTLELELQPMVDRGPDDFMIVSSKAGIVPTNFEPYVFERHLHEYCQWKFEQQRYFKASISQPILPAELVSVDNHTVKQTKPTQKQLALYYFYLQAKNYISSFKVGNLESEYINVTKPYGLAWKPFQMAFNKLQRMSERVHPDNIKSITTVIDMLAEYPLAKKMAEDELNLIKTRNPLT